MSTQQCAYTYPCNTQKIGTAAQIKCTWKLKILSVIPMNTQITKEKTNQPPPPKPLSSIVTLLIRTDPPLLNTDAKVIAIAHQNSCPRDAQL